MTLCLMIKKKHLIEKLEAQQRTGSFIERRAYKKYWRSRIGSTGVWSTLRKSKAVFLCGRHAFDAEVLKVGLEKTKTGIDDVVTTEVCYAIKCQFTPEAIDELERNYGEYEREIRDSIKYDYCITFFHEY